MPTTVRKGQIWRGKGYRYRIKVLRLELGEKAWCRNVEDHRGRKVHRENADYFYLSFNTLRCCYELLEVEVKAKK